MPGRGRASFTKRQKERSRQEKQREKAERKNQRKLEKQAGGAQSYEMGTNQMFEEDADPTPETQQAASLPHSEPGSLPGSGQDE